MAAIDFPSSPVNDQVFGLYKYNSAVGAWLVNVSALTTLGTVTVGTWNASPIAIAYGGTGATDVAGARLNLGLAGLSGIQTFTGSQTFIPSDSGTVPVYIRGLIGQSTSLTQWVSPAGGTILSEIDSAGGFTSIYGNFNADSATRIPLIVRGTAGQSANLQNWQIQGTPVASINSAGTMTANAFAATSNGAGTSFKVGDDLWIGDIDAANTMGLRGVSTPANAYINFGNGNTASLGRAGTGPLNYTSNFSVNSTTALGQLTVIPAATGTIGAVIRGMAGQTANLQEWQTSTPTTAVAITPAGVLTAYAGINLSNATSNLIKFNAQGLGAPTFTSYSAGAKVVIWDDISASSVGWGFGIENGSLWSSVGTSSNSFKWYGGTTLAATLTGAGGFLLEGDIAIYGGDIYTAAATNSGLFSDTTTGNVTLGGALTTGTFTIGAAGSTGAVSLFPATGAQNITIGGATTGTITIGSTLATAVQLPTGDTKIGTTFLAQGGAFTYTFPSVANGTLYASGNTDVALLDGGTNASLTAIAGGIVYSTASAMGITAAGTQNQVLKSNAAGVPSWQTLDLTYMPDSAYKKSVVCASTADIDASLQTANTLTGYSNGAFSYSCTTTAGSATVNLASGTTAGLKVGATVTVNASFPSVVTVATIVSATQFTVSSGTGIVAGTAVATTFTNTIAALTMDGITPALNDRVLIKNQTKVGGVAVTANRDNGIYYVSTLGSTTVAWVLTRVTDGDSATEIAGATVNVDQGTAQGAQLWSNNFKPTDTLGTTAMVWNRLLNDGDWATAATASKAVLRGTSGQVTATNYFTTVATLASDTIALTFSTNAGIQYRTGVAGAITFTGASYTAGSSINVFITNGATLQTLTFPAGWIFVGTKPTNLAASKTAVLTVTSLGTTEAACVASWAVQV